MKFSLFCNCHRQDRVNKNLSCIWILGFVQELMRLELLLNLISSLTLPPSATFTRSPLTFQAGRSLLTWDSQAENHVGFCCAAACSYLSGLTGHGPWESPSICLNASRWSPESLLTSSIFPPAKILTVFFQGPLLLSGKQFFLQDPSFQYLLPPPPRPHFPNLNSLYAEAQCVISLLIVSSVPCLFI